MELKELIEIAHQRALTDAEKELLSDLLQQLPREQVIEELSGMLGDLQPAESMDQSLAGSMLEAIMAQGQSLPASTQQQARIRRFRTRWWQVAAAVLIIIGGSYWLYDQLAVTPADQTAGGNKLPPDSLKGPQAIILTLADGSKVNVDSLKNRSLMEVNGVAIRYKDGGVVYDSKHAASVSYNTMSTPNGRQFHLQLPDGTLVWLNALSSITYPTSFREELREVSVKGEAYFEVARNKSRPFQVRINDQTAITVLGTSFNVNAYQDEQVITTTLLDGAIRIRSGQDSMNLKPGQQMQNKPSGGISQVKELTDLYDVIAWKNGLFNFNDAGLLDVTRQLKRWYGIEVKFEGTVPEKVFRGELDRGVKLEAVLNWLTDLGIKNRLEGNTLIISNN